MPKKLYFCAYIHILLSLFSLLTNLIFTACHISL